MEIGGLQKTTLIDFPGRVAATVFLFGCNFRCQFCYSAELVLPEKMKLQPRITEEEFFSFLEGKKGLLEGVVVCGGEPTCSLELPDFLSRIKKLGFLTKIDTNGSNPEILRRLIREKLVDYVAMDVKAPKEKYEEIAGTGVDIKKIEESIELLKEGKVDYEFRTTIVPVFHSKEDIIEMAKWLTPAKNYYLQNFRPEKTLNFDLEKVRPYPAEFLEEIKREISPLFGKCRVRT
jgi:pyruvate formate lyase activating enzyme